MPQLDQMQVMLERLSTSGREIWERWMAAVETASGAGWVRRAEEAYLQGLDQAQATVERNLRLQAESIESWRKLLEATPMAAFSEGMLRLAEQALGQRTELWNKWFETARQMDFRAMERMLDQSGASHEVMSAFKDISRQAMERQTDWFKSLVGQSLEGSMQASELAVVEVEAEAGAEAERPKTNGASRARTSRAVPARTVA